MREARSTVVTIAGHPYLVEWAGAVIGGPVPTPPGNPGEPGCVLTVSPLTASVGAQGGTIEVRVTRVRGDVLVDSRLGGAIDRDGRRRRRNGLGKPPVHPRRERHLGQPGWQSRRRTAARRSPMTQARGQLTGAGPTPRTPPSPPPRPLRGSAAATATATPTAAAAAAASRAPTPSRRIRSTCASQRRRTTSTFRVVTEQPAARGRRRARRAESRSPAPQRVQATATCTSRWRRPCPAAAASARSRSADRQSR